MRIRDFRVRERVGGRWAERITRLRPGGRRRRAEAKPVDSAVQVGLRAECARFYHDPRNPSGNSLWALRAALGTTLVFSRNGAHLTPSPREATGHSLLTAMASVICLVLAATLRLAHTDLAVWTTFLVMAQYTHTSFQKGIERVVGRGVGILAGLVLTTWFNDVPLVAFLFIGVLLSACFYIYFSGRLAYTALQAGLYLVAVFQIGRFSPETVKWEARELFAAVLVGVFVADVVNWLAGFEG